MRLYIGNLPFTATEQDMHELFASFRPVEVKLIADRDTGRSRGFGFVDCQDGARAIESLNGYEYGGRELTVTVARPLRSEEAGTAAHNGASSRQRDHELDREMARKGGGKPRR